MDEEIEVSEFDVWYQQLIDVLARDGLRAPNKQAWIDLYELGMTPEKAAPIGPYVTVNE
ncbi:MULTISPECIES: hypothetical protein [Klebsiella pneumoniae complex]|uniref:hypothetical protein n=1 Tax=Klebsiella pneumoniae complex TaxID=3390273 RepID=UPI00065A2064|nr:MULTISPECIES: hypothetical protein [Klebsiella]HDS4030329.1 hypothetical protein [Klebsiella pneumoniae subsp. pneumoniae]KMH13706.1 hypothetical protein SM66_03492 [Klebsiella quasipneumoniae subsp. quasipneumoniae]MDS0453229.1 hypothetical protein [Klebsiella quasipneumoniae]MDS0480534.1 hypothetical protein [Klebsiella quasipneumoniae]MDW8794500.1 hypothetical protein [Klebsiella pneumoniae]